MSTTEFTSNGSPLELPRESLDAALLTAFQRHLAEAITGDLHAVVCAYVRQRRESGALAADVVIDVKRLIGLADTRGPRSPERRDLADQIITMCIAEYYRAD